MDDQTLTRVPRSEIERLVARVASADDGVQALQELTLACDDIPSRYEAACVMAASSLFAEPRTVRSANTVAQYFMWFQKKGGIETTMSSLAKLFEKSHISLVVVDEDERMNTPPIKTPHVSCHSLHTTQSATGGSWHLSAHCATTR